MKRMIRSAKEFNREWNTNPDISQDEAYGLKEFKYWILEANKKSISIDELADYIYSRTYGNSRSGYYQNESNLSYFEALSDLIDRCSSTLEVVNLSKAAYKDFDNAREDYTGYKEYKEESIQEDYPGLIWPKYRKPEYNWTDDSFTKAETEYGLDSRDFRASNMKELCRVATKMGVNYRILDEHSIDVVISEEAGSLFEDIIRHKKCVNWEPEDFSNNYNNLTIHFSK